MCVFVCVCVLVLLPASDLAGLIHCSLPRGKCCIKLPLNLAKRLDSGPPPQLWEERDGSPVEGLAEPLTQRGTPGLGQQS